MASTKRPPRPAKRKRVSSLAGRPPLSAGLGNEWIGAEEERLVLDVLRRKEPFRYYGHDPDRPPPMAAALEHEFASMAGTRFALAVSSGTAALEVALGALGIGPGDEVILPVWSWISCWTSIVRVGALPVPAEIDETLCLDPSEIRRLRTRRTKAVLVVHYQGVAADMEPLMAEASRAEIKVVEDCAESPGASYFGKKVGAIGDVGTFSFQYHKSITSGKGGMVTTGDPILYERAVRMHDLGQMRPYHHRIIAPTQPAFSGSQFRMSELHAAVALAQLRKLDRLHSHCRRMRDRLMAKIADLPGLEFRRIPDPSGDMGFETYILLKDARQAADFCRRLQGRGVPCYPRTGTDCHYTREYCTHRLTHAPAASPFAKFRTWPAGVSQGGFSQDRGARPPLRRPARRGAVHECGRGFCGRRGPPCPRSDLLTQMKPCLRSSEALWSNLVLVAVYATAMGMLEAICVVYLRHLVLPDRTGPIDAAAMARFPIEPCREACTILMLVAVGWLAGTSLATRFGFFIAAFGIWDVWYYVGLYVWAGWPTSLLEWDCLFLLPCPWYGPVLAPVLISLSFVVSCICLIVTERAGQGIRPTLPRVGLLAIGWVIWILSFTLPAGLLPGQGHPASYPWWALLLGMISAQAATWPVFRRIQERVG